MAPSRKLLERQSRWNVAARRRGVLGALGAQLRTREQPIGGAEGMRRNAPANQSALRAASRTSPQSRGAPCATRAASR